LLTTFAGPERATAFIALGTAVAVGALAWSASRGFLPMLRLRA
jgi:hypothetical protein